MQKQHRLKHAAHKRTQTVCADHREVVEATELGKTASATLNTSVTTVDQRYAEQRQCLTDYRAATTQLRTGRSSLRDMLRAVVKLSRFVKSSSGFPTGILLARGKSDEERLSDARATLDEVTAHSAAYFDVGLARSFPTDLQAQIDGFAAARAAQTRAQTNYSAATRDIEAALAAGGEAIEMIDAVLVNAPDPGPAVLAKVRSAKRIGPRIKEQQPAAPAATPEPAAKTA